MEKKQEKKLQGSTSFKHPLVLQIFAEYEAITQKDIEETIKKEFSGSIEKGMLAIGKDQRN